MYALSESSDRAYIRFWEKRRKNKKELLQNFSFCNSFPVGELATKAAQLAENLPDGVAIKEIHLADLLFQYCLAKTIRL